VPRGGDSFSTQDAVRFALSGADHRHESPILVATVDRDDGSIAGDHVRLIVPAAKRKY